MGKGENAYPFTAMILDTPPKTNLNFSAKFNLTAFENIVGKEEIARNEQFLLFPKCFLLNQKIVSPFVNIFDIISLFSALLEEPKISMWGKGLICCLVKSYRAIHPHDSIFSWEIRLNGSIII